MLKAEVMRTRTKKIEQVAAADDNRSQLQQRDGVVIVVAQPAVKRS